MSRAVALTLALSLALSHLHAAAADAAAPASAPITLAELESRPTKTPPDPDYGPWAMQTTQDALRLIESGTLRTGEEFYRVSKLLLMSDNAYRIERVRHELRLSAAALDHAPAEKEIAATWDSLLHALGRPLRTDFIGLVQRHPDTFSSDPAPACVQAVLRDPAQAREAAKDAERNAEIKSIVDADQADRRRDWSKLSEEDRKAIGERDDTRNRRTREIIAASELHTAQDFANAALIMQHSANFAGYQTAHELAVCAMLLGDRSFGRWLVTATYDRMLGSVGHDQRFGTQYHGFGPAMTLAQVDTTGICDAERKALGCPTLEEARNRTAKSESSAEQLKIMAEFTGPSRSLRDPKFGLAATYPEGWKVRDVKRWGDQQNTIFFEIENTPEPSPNLYYRVYRSPRPMTAEQLTAFVREEVRKKQEARRENLPDYTNRADSFKAYQVGAYPAFSWLADFTTPEGEKWAEYFVRLQTDFADASFFLQAPADRIEALRPVVDRFMAGLKMPELAK
jgi:hypothetical protein